MLGLIGLKKTQGQVISYSTAISTLQGGKDQRELELGERMSNEAVDINAEKYKKVVIINKIKMAAGDFAFGIKKLI